MWLYIGFLLPFTSLHATTGGPVTVGYLVDYQFADLQGNWQATYGTENKVSDWDADCKAGGIGCAYWDHISVSNTSTANSTIEMRKPFLPQTSGTISVEFRFLFLQKLDGMIWAVRAGRDKSLIQFSTSGGNFGYLSSSGTFVSLISNYSINTAYTAHADVNITNATVDYFVDGVKLASAVPFANPSLEMASQFYMSVPATGVQHLYYLTITKGYKVYERFTNAKVNTVPTLWTTSVGSTVQVAHGSNPKDTMSCALSATSSTLGCPFTSSTNKLVWEFKFRLPTKMDGITAQLRSGSTSAVTFTTQQGGLAYYSSIYPVFLNYQVIWPNYVANLWYVVRIVADPTTLKADIYINGKLMASQIWFGWSVSSLDNILFTTPATGTSQMWVDDIYVYDFQPPASDYVPAPQAPPKLPYYVGMQSFFAGWRDGHHVGWDWIYRYPNHDPYIGFYDDGNPEAMDWQLKCMAEAGVDFFMDCWYLNNDGFPMKEPQFEYTEGPIHNAYFYAQYSNNVKFAIADYTMQTTTLSDFTNYILPYWMEYYIKDPRYFVIPSTIGLKGAPVIGIGFATTWMTAPNNAMQNSIAALRTAVQAAGYDNPVILGLYTGSDKPTLDSLKAAGIDYCYAYDWGTNNITTIQNNLTAQLSASSTLKPIADATQGWSGEAWDINSRGYVSLTDFASMNNWMKNTFLPSSTQLANKMVLFDNWNEFGEGHYICPTNLAGFGYVDAIHSAFTTSTTTQPHDTLTPAQKSRINVLHTRGWDGRVWAFDSLYPDTEGWTAGNGQITGLAQNNGYLEGTISGSDSILYSGTGYAIDASLYNQIKVRMKNSSTGTTAKFYFLTGTDHTWNETKAKSFNLVVSDTNYTEYTVDMSAVAAWAGTIWELRFDPVDTGASSGTFSIDYIKVVAAPTTVMQDVFSYTTTDITGHAPTTGTGTWSTNYGLSNDKISTSNSTAIITTNGGTLGAGTAVANYAFTPQIATVYTLNVTLNYTGYVGATDCWAGLGFSTLTGGGYNSANPAPWILIRPQSASGVSGATNGFNGTTGQWSGTVPSASYSGPIRVTLTWDTSTWQVQYYINGLPQGTWTTGIPAVNQTCYVFFEGSRTGNVVNVTNVSLTSTPSR